MCLRPRLPQLPVRHKPPNTPPQTEENLQKKNRKIAGFSAQSFAKTQLSLQRVSFISLCYCKCASIQACFENITLPFSLRAFRFLSRHSAMALVSLLFLQEDWQVLTMYLAPWRDLPTHAIRRHFVANPVRRQINLLYSAHVSVILPIIPKIFSFRLCTLNCELRYGCKLVSSTRLLLFTLSRLPSPWLHSASLSEFKETLKKREAASEAFYDFIGPEEALLGRCCTFMYALSLIMSPQTAAVCSSVEARVYIMYSPRF